MSPQRTDSDSSTISNTSSRRSLLLLLLAAAAVATAAWLLTRQPPDHAALLQKAIEAEQRGDPADSLAILTDLHRLRPSDPVVGHRLANACVGLGKTDEAVSVLEQVLNSEQDHAAKARYQTAGICIAHHRTADAVRLLQQTIKLAPEFTDARRLLIHQLLITTRWQQMRSAISEIDSTAGATPDDIRLFCSGGIIVWEDSEHLSWLEDCLRVSPADATVRAALAYFYLQAGRRDDAVILFKLPNGQSVPANWWRVRLVETEHLIETGNYQRAADILGTLPREAETMPRTWLAHGRLLMQQDHNEAALRAFTNAALLDPFNPQPEQARCGLLAGLHRHEAADQSLNRAEKLRRLLQLNRSIITGENASGPVRLEYANLLSQTGCHRGAMICLKSLSNHPSVGEDAGTELQRLMELHANSSLVLCDPSRIDRTVVEDTANTAASSERNAERRSDAASIHFEDVANDVKLNSHFESGHSGKHLLLETLGGGVAVLDYDNDLWPDIFFSQGKTLGDTSGTHNGHQLHRNRRSVYFDDVSRHIETDNNDYGQGCATADFNSDGFTDLFVCTFGTNVLLLNNGDGTWTDISEASGFVDSGWNTSACFADFDGDGNPDLYVARYLNASLTEQELCSGNRTGKACGPGDYPAQQDLLFMNRADGTFSEQSESAGIVTNDGNGKGLGVIAADFDLDGQMDVFVGNDGASNYLFRNVSNEKQAPAFMETAAFAGVAVNGQGIAEATMGITCGDVDGDGDPDLMTTNFLHESNTLFVNQGSAVFFDESTQFRLADDSRSQMGWGAQFLDANNDGGLDLLIANSHLHDTPMPLQLYLTATDGIFRPVASVECLTAPRHGRAVAVMDWNGDQKTDLVLTCREGPAALFSNNSECGTAATVLLSGTYSNRDGIGATLTARTGHGQLTRRIPGGGGYFAANERGVRFGTGQEGHLEKLTIHWPAGTEIAFSNVTSGRTYLATENGRLYQLTP